MNPFAPSFEHLGHRMLRQPVDLEVRLQFSQLISDGNVPLRMAEAYVDAPAMLAILLEAAAYAASREMGLFEATQVIVPGVPASYPPGTRVITPDGRRYRSRSLRKEGKNSRREDRPNLFYPIEAPDGSLGPQGRRLR